MSSENQQTSVIDFAYAIIDLYEENLRLHDKIEHLEDIQKIHRDSIASSEQHTKEITGMIIGAALDPNSSINRGSAALLREEYK